MIIIRTQTGEVVVLDSSARLLSGVNGNGEHAAIAEVPVGSACEPNGRCSIDREAWTLAEVADKEAADRVLAILWRRMGPGCRVDMAEVLREAGA